MSSFPRLRMDIAIGLLAVGTVWYILTRDSNRRSAGAGSGHESSPSNDEVAVEKMLESQPGSLEVLSPLLMDPALFEKIMLASDPRTILRTAQVSKYHNEAITTSPSLQLLLRTYYHQIPTINRPSSLQRQYLHQPKKRQLDDLIGREERLSRFKHTKFQRCSMPYIDVLCSGDYTVVTRCLSGRLKTEGVPESGPVEDGYTVMIPNVGSQGSPAGEDEEEGDGSGSKRKARRGLEGYAQRTVDVGGEIADIGVRSDDDLIVLATIVPEEEVLATGREVKPQVVRVAFYHLETFTPRSPHSEFAIPISHSGARLQVAEFAFDQPFTSIRVRAGPEGRLLIWAKDDRDKAQTTAMIYDWRKGVALGYAWRSGEHGGIPHDFSFLTPDILLVAVLKTAKKGSRGYTPTLRSAEQTRLEIQTWRLPDPALFSRSHKRVTTTELEPHDELQGRSHSEPNGFDFGPLCSCRPVATYKFPPFTYKWRNPRPMDDELPQETGQTFNLFHCSVAAKPSPLSYESKTRQGILCVTIEGDFGPFTHPQGDPHDHGAIAFCTISGSAFNPPPLTSSITRPGSQPRVHEYEEWQNGNVSWDFGPQHTWMTGFGTRTALVTRYVGLSQDIDQAGLWETQEPNRTTVMKLVLRNYDPVAVSLKGKVYRHPLGRARDPSTDGDEMDTDIETGIDERADAQANVFPIVEGMGMGQEAMFFPPGMENLFTMTLPPFHLHAPAPGTAPAQAPAAAPPAATAAGAQAAAIQLQLADILRSIEQSPNANNSFKIIQSIEHGPKPEIFSSETSLKSSIPYFESNVTIEIPEPDLEKGDEERGEAGMEHPFKTILVRDRLIVCDDGGFDILSI